MNKEDLIKKIKALADRGIGGEKENAQKLLKELMQKYNINEEEINEDIIKEFDIKMPKVYKAADLANQVLYSIVGRENGENKGLYSWRRTKHYFVRCTASKKSSVSFLKKILLTVLLKIAYLPLMITVLMISYVN